jgi:hypothetical protein
MKSIPGLVLAIGLGLIGAVFNWMYLHGGPNRDATTSFVGIKEGRRVNRGDVLKEADIAPLVLPELWVGNLRSFAVLDKDRATVIGMPVGRTLEGPCLLLADDLKTPKERLPLEPDEDAMPIPVDSRTFVPSLFEPGDTVSFLIPRGAGPTLAAPRNPSPPGNPAGPGVAPVPAADAAPPSPIEAIGPFTILALGNQLGSLEVMRKAKIQPVQQNILTIRVSSRVPGEKERAEKLWSLLEAKNFPQVGVMLHGRSKDKQ